MENLFAEFTPSDPTAWKSRIEKELKGITFDDLSVTDRNGLTIHPFYTIEDLQAPALPLFQNPDWEICSRIIIKDSQSANQEALAALQGGASGLYFVLQGELPQVDPALLLKDIEIKYIYLNFVLDKANLNFITVFREYMDTLNLLPSDLNCTLSYDPLYEGLQKGWSMGRSEEQDFLGFVADAGDWGHVSIRGDLFQNAGANSGFQLACIGAQLNEYLHWLDQAGQIHQVAKWQLTLATGTGFFEEIAKLRAIRQLLPLISERYNINPVVQVLVETSDLYRSPLDSYSNLLRDSIAGMAGVLGGCDALIIHTFDQYSGKHNSFSSRMSRNQQLIFKEESYLHKVADAAAGSYYIETLTEQIARKAWDQFKAIEQEGGLIAAFEKGTLQASIVQQAAALIQEYKEGKRILVGVNKYPVATEGSRDRVTVDSRKKAQQPGLNTFNLADVLEIDPV